METLTMTKTKDILERLVTLLLAEWFTKNN